MQATIDQLFIYPVKGCRGIAVERATLAATGLEIDGIGDREWVVVDADGEFLSQRELPQMALIETRLTSTALRLKAPGMLQLEAAHRLDALGHAGAAGQQDRDARQE